MNSSNEDLIRGLFRVDVEPLFPDSEWALPETPAIEVKALPAPAAAAIVDDSNLPTFLSTER